MSDGGDRIGHTVVQIQLRFCIRDTSSRQSDKFPSRVVVKVNNDTASLPVGFVVIFSRLWSQNLHYSKLYHFSALTQFGDGKGISLSILTVIIPDGPELDGTRNVSILDYVVAKDDGSGGDNCSHTTCKAPVK